MSKVNTDSENDNQNEKENKNEGENHEQKQTPELSPDVLDLVEKTVTERLSKIKASLDSAYQRRDAAEKKVAEYQKKEQDEKIRKLEEEGKIKEAYEAKLEEAQKRLRQLEGEKLSLTRDNMVQSALGALNFRNDKARNMVFKSLVGELQQDESGQWKHKSGQSVEEYLKKFSEEEENAFLFKPRLNRGTGTEPPAGKPAAPSSLFNMTQEDVLKLAAEGKLPKRK